MISQEHHSEASPDDLEKRSGSRSAAMTEREKNWHDPYSEMNYKNSDNSLNMSRFLAVAALAIIGMAIVWPDSFAILFGGWGIVLLYCLHTVIQERQKRKVIDKSFAGLFNPLPQSTTLWGLVIPLVVAISLFWYMPNSAIDMTTFTRWMFLSVLSVVSCVVVSRSVNYTLSKPRTLGFLDGTTVGTSLAIFLMFTATSCVTFTGFASLLILPTAGLLFFYSIGLAKKLLLKADRSVSFSTFGCACLGGLLTFAVAIGPELRGFAIAVGEKLALSKESSQADLGYRILHDTNASADIGRFIENQYNTNSIAQAVLPVSVADAERLYFFLSGEGYPLPQWASTSQYNPLARPLYMVPGLSLVDSKLTGIVDTNSLTSVTYWTMIFGNQTGQAQEAEATIALPAHAAVSRVTLWINGVPQEVAFNSTSKVTQAYDWVTKYHRDPILVTETSPGIIKIQAAPVPKYGEMKVRIGITAALEVRSKRDFGLTAPRIIDSNFDVEDTTTDLKLHSNSPITSSTAKSTTVSSSSKYLFQTQIAARSKNGSNNGYQFAVHRATDFTSFTARATHSREDMVISEKLEAVNSRIGKIAVVIDGSESVSTNRHEIKQALASIPNDREAKVFLVNHRNAVEGLSVKDAIDRLSSIEYSAGCDDTAALVAARKYIGRQTTGVIAWIHGPQPVVLLEDALPLHDLMGTGAHRVRLYDLQIKTDSINQVKNYLSSLSPSACPIFHAISNEGSLARDLTSFFKSVGTQGYDSKLVFEKVSNTHLASTNYDFPVASRVSSIWAADEARKCAALGDVKTAQALAIAYRVVTPVTGAVVLETEDDYKHQNLQRNMYSVVSKKTHASGGTADGTSTYDKDFESEVAGDNAAEPLILGSGRALDSRFTSAAPVLSSGQQIMLQGATNGTIGPQGEDATMVTGVNTAGSLRYNYLADAREQNANVVMIAGMLLGGFFLFQGFCLKMVRAAATNKLLIGSFLIMIGFAAPRVIASLYHIAMQAHMIS